MKRIDYLDRARAIGMFLVYYGHFTGSLVVLMPSFNPASEQWRLIYSFHIPLFFFLSGIFWKPVPSFRQVLVEKLKTRILPVITFSLLLVPFWLTLAPVEFSKMLALSGLYLQGVPTLNLVTRFLVCLFTVELLAALTLTFLDMKPLRIVMYSTGFFVIGSYAFVQNLSLRDGWLGLLPNILQMDNAFIALMFFFAGTLLKNPLTQAVDRRGWIVSIPVFLASGYVLFRTFGLNQTAGRGVLMVASNYGDPILFLLTAFAGIFFILSLSRLLVLNVPYFSFVSQNTLIYLGLSGLCFQFVDGLVIKALNLTLKSHVDLIIYASLYVSLAMLVLAPVVIALRRWFPQLVGLAWSPTSWLPPLQTIWARKRDDPYNQGNLY